MGERRDPSRRALLATGISLAGGLAGCLDAFEESPDSRDTGRPAATDTASPERSERSPTCTDRATPPEPAVESPLAVPRSVSDTGGDCPARPDPDRDRICRRFPDHPECDADPAPAPTVVCAPPATAAAPLRLTASTERVTLPGAVAVTLVNGTTGPFAPNSPGVGLWKREGEAWYTLAVGSSDVPGEAVAPGDTRQFCVGLSDEASSSIDSAQEPVEDGGVWHARLGGLGGGEYAIGVFGDLIEPHASIGRPVGMVAHVTVDGPAIEMAPTGRVADVRTDGDVVRGRWTPGLDPDEAPSTAYILRRIGADRPAVPLIAEQLVRHQGASPLRDAVALAGEHDARVVRLLVSEDAFGAQALPTYPISYEGAAFVTRLEVP